MRLSPRQREALNLVADGRIVPTLVREDDGWHARWRAACTANESLDGWIDSYVREFTLTRLSEDAEDQKHETLHDAWMLALRSQTGLVRWDDAECAAFAAELEAWGGNAEDDVAARGKVEFHFETSGEKFEVRCTAPKGRRVLKALGQSVYVWPPLGGLKLNTEASPCLCVKINHLEAEDFVRRGARELRDAGYRVIGADLAASVTASAEMDASSAGDALSLSPVKCKQSPLKLTVRVAGEPVTAEEVRFLLDQGSTLVFFRDRWIEVDRGILKEALRALEKGVDKKANPLTFALGLGHIGRLELEEVKAHGWLRGLVNELRDQGSRFKVQGSKCTIAGFVGELRDYQQRGVEWLSFLTSHGFGALLADDMGLGKTIQVIAWLLSTRANHQLPTTNYQPPTTNYQLPTTNYQLPTTNFSHCRSVDPSQQLETRVREVRAVAQGLCPSRHGTSRGERISACGRKGGCDIDELQPARKGLFGIFGNRLGRARYR